MRQMGRLQEPDEMAVLRHFHKLGALSVRSTYGATGLMEREIRLPPHPYNTVVGVDDQLTGVEFVPVDDADTALAMLGEAEEHARMLTRREDRLPEHRRSTSLSGLTAEEKRILRLSKTEYARFRAPAKGQGREGKPPAESAAKPSGSPASKSTPEGGKISSPRGGASPSTQAHEELGASPS
jgi:hypothetical protein